MSQLTLPPALETKLADFRRRVWIVKLAEGLLAAAFGLALSFIAVFVLDRFMETPAWLRAGIMVLGALGLGLGLPLKWHRWVWQQRRLEDAAKLLKRTFPRLGDQLLGIVELSRYDDGSGRSDRLVQAAMNQAAEAVKDVSFDNAVPNDRHARWAWIAGGVGAVAVAAFALVPAAAWNAMARWITPWREVDRYTFAKIEKLNDKRVVPYAEPVDLKAMLRKDTEWSPEGGKAVVKGQPNVTAKREGDGYDFKLPPQKKDAPLNLSIGDVRKTIELVPTQRPELKALQAKLSLPDYLGYKTQPTIEARSGTVSVIKGAQASFVLTASRALSTATMDGQPQPVVDGLLQTKPSKVEASVEHKFEWADKDGLAAREPLTIKVQAVDDEMPRVLARRDTQEQVVIDTEVVTFDLEASDDFGIKRVGLEWKGNDPAKPAQGESVSAAGGNEMRALNAKATFCAKRDGVEPQTIELRAWAEDYATGHRAVSPGTLLQIMSKDDHALWMTEQFGKWLQAARETYEIEQRLHETNRELRALKAEELDRPENRRKVQQQAAAEMGNRDRLDRLNDAGRKMVEQAARNDAFDAQRLEQWAGMLKSLKDIAGKRMPTVADMLKKSASEQSGKAGEPQKSDPAAPSNPSDPSKSTAKSDGKPGDKPQEPSPAGKSSDAPKVANGEQSSGPAKPQKQDPNAPEVPKAPTVADNEKSHFENKPQDNKPGDPSKPSSGKLGLPSTTLGSPDQPKKPDQQTAENDKESPAQKQLDSAIEEQKKLLEAFAKTTDSMKELLASLEGSTFVKRLKAASRKEMSLANALNSGSLDSFGVDKKKVSEQQARTSNEIAAQQVETSNVVRVIQADLDAYYQRKQDMKFKNILEQMKKSEVVAAIARIGDEAKSNWSGRSIAASEYWADVLDRWSEEMVAAAKAGGKGKSGGNEESLPPEIVLKVMQVLFDEMKLRDETREAEAAKPAMEKKDYFKRATGLALKQDDIGKRSYEAAVEISKLPKADSFKKELKLISDAVNVMKDAYSILDKPDTGAPAVAAETEVIEMLLEARRQPPGGGGGGGGSNPGGGGSAASAQGALAELGPGGNMDATVQERAPGQATGKAGKEFPEEFKAGLDSYFNALEAGQK